jgi:hypothetical protein
VQENRSDQEFQPYQAYVIRLCPTSRQGVTDYRVSLQDVATGDRREFPTLGQFICFIQSHKVANTLDWFR